MSHEEAADRELARWLGVRFTRTKSSNHARLILSFGERSEFVIYPSSPSDSYRGAQNHIADIRLALRRLGATRTPEPKATAKRSKSKRHEAVYMREDGLSRLARDPWEILRKTYTAADELQQKQYGDDSHDGDGRSPDRRRQAQGVDHVPEDRADGQDGDEGHYQA